MRGRRFDAPRGGELSQVLTHAWGVFVFGVRRRPGGRTGVNAKDPSPMLGCPMLSKGCDVPRPTLTTVGSNRHSDGYKSIEVDEGRLGLGRMAN